jgi:hypothetical protein
MMPTTMTDFCSERPQQEVMQGAILATRLNSPTQCCPYRHLWPPPAGPRPRPSCVSRQLTDTEQRTADLRGGGQGPEAGGRDSTHGALLGRQLYVGVTTSQGVLASDQPVSVPGTRQGNTFPGLSCFPTALHCTALHCTDTPFFSHQALPITSTQKVKGGIKSLW